MNWMPEERLRKNIKELKPYTSARDEYSGREGIFLDANENSFGSVTSDLHHRYPDPLQWEVKHKLAGIKGVRPDQIFLGNGSDEAIDLVYRCFADPGVDNVVLTPPTYGMYEVSAHINAVECRKVSLDANYQLKVEAVLEQVDAHTKAIFLCSPNNPTGNALEAKDIQAILQDVNCLVVLDEAYIDFCPEKSWVGRLDNHPNLLIMQTFSKAWGLANIRLGVGYASAEIVRIFNKVKSPYNVSGLTQQTALEALGNERKKNEFVEKILSERHRLAKELSKLECVITIYPSDANFLLVKTLGAKTLYDYLASKKIIVRDRSNVVLCEGCLRITVGTPLENDALVEAMRNAGNLIKIG